MAAQWELEHRGGASEADVHGVRVSSGAARDEALTESLEDPGVAQHPSRRMSRSGQLPRPAGRTVLET